MSAVAKTSENPLLELRDVSKSFGVVHSLRGINFSIRPGEVMGLLGGAVAWPIGAQAQQSRVPLVGFLASASQARYTATVTAIRKGLSDGGFVENMNVKIEYRWADFQYDRLPALAAELVKRPVDAIFATGSVVSALAAKSATAPTKSNSSA